MKITLKTVLSVSFVALLCAGCNRKPRATDANEMVKSGKEERFVIIYSEGGGMWNRIVLEDRKTGQQYLWVKSGYAGGVTLMPNTPTSP